MKGGADLRDPGSRDGGHEGPGGGERKKTWSGLSFAAQTYVQLAPSASLATTGFDSERVWGGDDDWEPAVAADPGAPYVYQMTTRFTGSPAEIIFRRSVDGGATWSESELLSDLGFGAPYKGPLGYSFVYGDYFEIAIDGDDVNHIIWGEGTSYTGPGGSWYTRVIPVPEPGGWLLLATGVAVLALLQRGRRHGWPRYPLPPLARRVAEPVGLLAQQERLAAQGVYRPLYDFLDGRGWRSWEVERGVCG